MRGALALSRTPGVIERIIPAYAGSTPSYCRGRSIPGDHPRVCGEHFNRTVAQLKAAGSSPRMRGALSTPWLRSRRTKDHPRVCGEHLALNKAPNLWLGSSPRMRGARTIPGSRPTPVGIIPAYAGSTHQDCHTLSNSRDHPRVCGEHETSSQIDTTIRGSSPRMRGARRRPAATPAGPGIIPAYAGSTRGHELHRFQTQDHPRVCGEHLKYFSNIVDGVGSSPRMRGARMART